MAENKKNEQKFGGVKPSKKIWKKWWFWLIAVIVLAAMGYGNSDDTKEPEKQQTETTTTQTPETEATKEPEITASEEQTTEPQAPEETELIENTEETESVEHREGMYGISDKNIDDAESRFTVSKARNDVTGNWKISCIAEAINIEEYALSYYNKYFADDKEVHIIVNFTYNTSTTLTCLGNILDVSIREYVEKEEHDAKKMGSGMLLGEFYIYLDNGDIEEIQ